jgi:hypothetical protein
MHYGEIRNTLAEESRAERQVVILEPDHRWLCATLLATTAAKAALTFS